MCTQRKMAVVGQITLKIGRHSPVSHAASCLPRVPRYLCEKSCYNAQHTKISVKLHLVDTGGGEGFHGKVIAVLGKLLDCHEIHHIAICAGVLRTLLLTESFNCDPLWKDHDQSSK